MAGGSFDGGDMSNMDNNQRTNLIVNYLPQTMTEKDLYSLFVPFGLLESCRVMRDYKVGCFYFNACNRHIKRVPNKIYFNYFSLGTVMDSDLSNIIEKRMHWLL